MKSDFITLINFIRNQDFIARRINEFRKANDMAIQLNKICDPTVTAKLLCHLRQKEHTNNIVGRLMQININFIPPMMGSQFTFKSLLIIIVFPALYVSYEFG